MDSTVGETTVGVEVVAVAAVDEAAVGVVEAASLRLGDEARIYDFRSHIDCSSFRHLRQCICGKEFGLLVTMYNRSLPYDGKRDWCYGKALCSVQIEDKFRTMITESTQSLQS